MMLNNYDELNYRNIKVIVIRTKFKIQMTCIITHKYTHIHTHRHTHTRPHSHTCTLRNTKHHTIFTAHYVLEIYAKSFF